MPKLTKNYVESLKAESKSYEAWDTDIKGFGVMVQPSGRKTYYFVYRHKDAKKERLKVGVHGNVTCEIARDIVRGWAGDLARGINPKEHGEKQKMEEKQSMLFSDFWKIFTEKYILVEHKESTQKGNKSRIHKDILPFFGNKRIAEIKREDILAFEDSLSHVRPNFRKCLDLLSAAFNKAELWGYRNENTNPCTGIPRPGGRTMERFMNDMELQKLEGILTIKANFPRTAPYTLAAVWMLIVTGCRCNEILTLPWEGVHLADDYIYLKDSKVGVRAIPLSEKAKQILAPLQKRDNNPYVFCGKIPGQPLKNIKYCWYKARRLAGFPDVRIHDIRHSFASFAIKKGVDIVTVSKLLGHKNIATTMRYIHLELEQLKKATNKVSETFLKNSPAA